MNGIEKETTEICKQIQNLTKQIEENIKMIENNQNVISLKNIKINIIEKDDDKEKIFYLRKPAGKRRTKWDSTIINWKNSLRGRPYY